MLLTNRYLIIPYLHGCLKFYKVSFCRSVGRMVRLPESENRLNRHSVEVWPSESFESNCAVITLSNTTNASSVGCTNELEYTESNIKTFPITSLFHWWTWVLGRTNTVEATGLASLGSIHQLEETKSYSDNHFIEWLAFQRWI